MIELYDVSKSFLKRFSLKDVSLNIQKNNKIALMGPNGAGKTTLIRIILGLYLPDKGSVLVDGMHPAQKREKILKKVSFVPQLPPPIRLDVAELIEYASVSTGVKKSDFYYYADKMELDIAPILKRSFFNLSGGMKQKLLISMCLARKSEMMIFDEPTANLDLRAREAFYSILLQERGGGSLFVTHRENELKEIIDRKIYMDLGRIVSDETV